MSRSGTLELIKGAETVQTRFAIGSLVEVKFENAECHRIITYLGTVVARPEDKAPQTIVTEKQLLLAAGETEGILSLHQTYTINIHEKALVVTAPTPDGYAPDPAVLAPKLTDLIFDPGNPAFSIQAATPVTP